MRKLFSFLINRHQEIFRYFLVFLAIIFITFAFPKMGKFKYNFEKGKPWRYENLIAPFDFAIYKSEEDIKKERETLLKDFHPYYKVRTGVRDREKEEFISDFAKRIVTERTEEEDKLDSVQHVKFGLNILDSIYKRGVIALAEQHKDFDAGRQVNFIRDNLATTRTVSSFFKEREAYKFLIDTVKKAEQLNGNILIPLLQNAIRPNVVFADTLTAKLREELLQSISLTRGLVQEGEMIVAHGNIIDENKYQVLLSLKREYEERVVGSKKGFFIWAGYFLLTSVILLIFAVFLSVFNRDIFKSARKLLFLLMLITLMIHATAWITGMSESKFYIIPFCIVPIMARIFFGTQSAFFAHITVILLIGFIVPLGVEYQFLHFTAGLVAIFTNIRAHYWSQFFISSALILLTYWIGYLGVSFIQEGAFENIEWTNFGWLSFNVFLTLLAYPLIPIFEKIFGFVSEITLVELSDLNKPLLKELSLRAPGTFQHSLQVANLAEAAAYEIEANTLMVRVGALYHDIGKMENPMYFVENQATDVNPHDDLPFEESAQIIINHVPKGIEMAKKANLPDILIDFIRTHHGTSRVEYFYQSYLKNYPHKKVHEFKFRYPGPRPYSRETAIVMMSDSVEAAFRSIKNPTDKDADELVEKIINNKIEQEQFVNSDITFKDITRVKKVLKKMLRSIYHVRVAYPEPEE